MCELIGRAEDAGFNEIEPVRGIALVPEDGAFGEGYRLKVC